MKKRSKRRVIQDIGPSPRKQEKPRPDHQLWVELMDDLVGGTGEESSSSAESTESAKPSAMDNPAAPPRSARPAVPRSVDLPDQGEDVFDVQPTIELMAEDPKPGSGSGTEDTDWSGQTIRQEPLSSDEPDSGSVTMDLPSELVELATRTQPNIEPAKIEAARVEPPPPPRERTVTRSLVWHPSMAPPEDTVKFSPPLDTDSAGEQTDYDQELSGTITSGVPVSAQQASTPGIPFGNYRLLRKLKAGGMGEVFQGVFVGLEGIERSVAIKRILLPYTEVDEFIHLFIKEAKLTVQLSHAAIVQVLELGKLDGEYFIAMEYVHGHDLANVVHALRQTGQLLPVPIAIFIVQQVLEGLDYAHRKLDPRGTPLGVVHRDVSPPNILCSFEGQVKLTDFGLAKVTSIFSNTAPQAIIGKLGYMSPEQLEDRVVDRRSDIFAAGVVLHELLTGQQLFRDPADLMTGRRLQNKPAPPVRPQRPEVPEALEAILATALRRDPDERYAWASEMEEALQRIMLTLDYRLPSRGLAQLMEQLYSGVAPGEPL